MAHGPDITPAAGDFRPGSLRGTSGFFHIAQRHSGQWTLCDPEGRAMFARAVHGVRALAAEPVESPSPVVQLRAWGFNAVGVGGDGSGRDDGLPYCGEVGFASVVPQIVAPGVRLPDVFEPEWATRAAAHALLTCAPDAAERNLVGWVTDSSLAWGTAPGRPGLLQTCLSVEPSFAAYHAAWEFVLALHRGSVEEVGRAWSVPLANKEVVRELTRAETPISTRGYARDEARWAREFARRYLAVAGEAVRAADPNHLVFGPRFLAPVGPAILHVAQAPFVDVALPHWSEVSAGISPWPVIAGELSWTDPVFWSPAAASPEARRRARRLTSVEWMLRRARTVLRRLARHPGVVGYTWARWHDDPGEQPPFAGGLVHPNGREAREHTELLAEFNARTETLRRAATKQLAP